MRLTPERLEQVKNKLGRKALAAIVLGCLIFTLKVSLSASAGLMRIQVTKFAAGIVIAIVAWEGLYVKIGAIGKQVFKVINLPGIMGLSRLFWGQSRWESWSDLG